MIDDDLRVAAGAERERRGWLLWWPPWLCARKKNPLVRDALQRFVVVCSQWRRRSCANGGRGRNPNSGERVLCATCQRLIGQSNWSTGQLWSTGQSQQSTLVKTANMVK